MTELIDEESEALAAMTPEQIEAGMREAGWRLIQAMVVAERRRLWKDFMERIAKEQQP